MAGDLLDEPLVVDANVLFSALLRDGTTRHLLFAPGLKLFSPRSVWGELDRNRTVLVARSGTTAAAFDSLVHRLRSRIANLEPEQLESFRSEALRRTGERDRLDAPYVAAVLAVGGRLWTHDARLARAAGVRFVTTRELAAAWEARADR